MADSPALLPRLANAAVAGLRLLAVGLAALARDQSDYPGAEWAPLPTALLNRVAAHVLAREYIAWAAQRKAQY